MPQPPWTVILLFTLPAQLDDRCINTTPSFYWLRWGLTNFLPGLALNHDPPVLHLLISLDDKHISPSCLAFLFFVCLFLRQGLTL
jgi:hypothetical protein